MVLAPPSSSVGYKTLSRSHILIHNHRDEAEDFQDKGMGLTELEPLDSDGDPDYHEHSGGVNEGGDYLNEIKSNHREGSWLYTPEEELAVLHKLDRRLVLFLALLYMLSFLDRSNIGNARIAGLTRDLELNSSKYEWLLSAFYLSYVIFEPLVILYTLLPAHKYISVCVFSWGLIASLQAVAGSFTLMFILRALLGISEAAFGPGVPFFLSKFFKRRELAWRTGLFISAAPLATSFASTLAWFITKLGEGLPIAPWLLFLVEGFPSIIVAIIAYYQVPNSPRTASWLSTREKNVASLRLQHEKDRTREGRKSFRWKEVGRTLLDPKSYLTPLMFFSCNVAFASLPPFLPTIINEMAYSTLASQALSAPPYIVSFVLVLLVAHFSDRAGSRAFFVILSSLIGAMGYGLLAAAGALRLSSSLRYAAVYPAAAGFFCAINLIITWTINNQASNEGKGTGVAMLNVIGQLGPLLGTRLYPDSDRPYYVIGMSVCALFMLFVAALAYILRCVLAKTNEQAKQKPIDQHLGGEKGFVYML